MAKEIKTALEFEQILNDNSEVLATFWAPWCPDCRPFKGMIEQLAEEKKEKTLIVKLNIDEPGLEAIIKKYDIRAIPSAISFKNGVLKEKKRIWKETDLLDLLAAL